MSTVLKQPRQQLSVQAQSDPYDIPLDEIDLSDPSLHESDRVWGYYERLRKEKPVHYLKDSPFGPFWSITRFEDIQYVGRHHEWFSSVPTISLGDQPEDFAFVNFIHSDPPVHTEQRRDVQGVVSPRNISELESLIRTRVQEILDNLPVGEAFNWVERVSIELTTQMLATLFDFPYEDRRLLTYWSDVAVGTPEITGSNVISEEERRIEMGKCLDYFTHLWRDRENQEPKFDFISMMIHGESTKHFIDDPMTYLGTIILLIIGGNDTTRNAISGGVVGLNRFPDEYLKLREDSSLIPNMASEIIRWQTPVTHMRRTTVCDTELGGEKIKKGDKVVMWYGSGNRDTNVIDTPHDLIIDRRNAQNHLSFGHGIHRCMGSRLAIMELQVLWEEIQKRFERIELVGEPVFLRSNFIRGYLDVPVCLYPL